MPSEPLSDNKFRVVVLTHGGAELFLKKLSEVKGVEIAGVFVETRTQKSRSWTEKIRRSIRYDGWFETISKFGLKLVGSSKQNGDVGSEADSNRNKLADLLKDRNIPLVFVEDYHSESSIEALKEAKADLGVLYGTNIVRKEVFSIPRLGSINIHQGLAPYYRGGPTVFWELFNGESEVGITVHWVASKVDTGDIIYQTAVPLDYDLDEYGLDYENFFADFRASLVEPSASLLVRSIQLIAEGTAPRMVQDISLGKRYKLPVKSEKDELLRILIKRQKARRS